MANNRHREALLASAARLSPFVPSNGTGPFVETKFAASKLEWNASRSVGGAAGGAGGAPPVTVTERTLFINPRTSEGTKFLTAGVGGFPYQKRILSRDEFGVFLAAATKDTKGSYRELKETYIEDCDFALFYKNSDEQLLGFATIKLMEGKELEVTLLISILQKEGYGTDLLKAVNDIAKAAGYTRIVIKSTPEAQAFYKKSGYKNFDMENSLVLMNKSVTRRRRANRRKGTRRQRK